MVQRYARRTFLSVILFRSQAPTARSADWQGSGTPRTCRRAKKAHPLPDGIRPPLRSGAIPCGSGGEACPGHSIPLETPSRAAVSEQKTRCPLHSHGQRLCFFKNVEIKVSHVAFPPSDFRHDLTPSAVGLYVPVTDGGVLIAASDHPPAFFPDGHSPIAFPVWFHAGFFVSSPRRAVVPPCRRLWSFQAYIHINRWENCSCSHPASAGRPLPGSSRSA